MAAARFPRLGTLNMARRQQADKMRHADGGKGDIANYCGKIHSLENMRFPRLPKPRRELAMSPFSSPEVAQRLRFAHRLPWPRTPGLPRGRIGSISRSYGDLQV